MVLLTVRSAVGVGFGGEFGAGVVGEPVMHERAGLRLRTPMSQTRISRATRESYQRKLSTHTPADSGHPGSSPKWVQSKFTDHHDSPLGRPQRHTHWSEILSRQNIQPLKRSHSDSSETPAGGPLAPIPFSNLDEPRAEKLSNLAGYHTVMTPAGY